MTQPSGARTPADDVSLLAQVTILLKWRRKIITWAAIGGVLGLASGLLATRLYRSTGTFLPQGSEASGSAVGLALAASQLGIRLPMAGNTWGPPVYAAVLRSRALLAVIAVDSISVAEEGGRVVAVSDLLKIKAPTPYERVDRTVVALGRVVRVRELKALNAVEVAVTTRWPSVSFAIANRLVTGVQRFNVETRKSQAAAERQFVEARAEEAQLALREAEDRLQDFLQRNRSFVAPELAFHKDRLQREVMVRQEIYTTLLQSREEARIREVRDTPVITILEEPRLPVLGEPRGTPLKAALGALAGGLLCLIIAFLSEGLSSARGVPSDHAREFFRLVDQATPRFLRKKGR